ncbi:acyl-CoA dehydrogenase family protein [Streptomyces sp. NPDC047028]|uniref:acyl-CoA dehydrogenase family protein n=1 Tax=Streptomyces sp. NPDC047028 TaxID=3155793 RepID=UPI003408046B
MAGTSTHTVTNQPPPLSGYDVFGADRALVEAVERHLGPGPADAAHEELSALGRTAGSAQVQEWATQADAHPPRLRTHDRYGHRIDEVEFHPAWHRLLGKGVSAGLTGAWSRPGGHVRRAAAFLVWSQVEAGTCGPLSMTHAAVPALRADPDLAAEWEPRLASTVYDRELRPAVRKPGVLVGTGVTEKQGGTGTVTARPLAEDGAYALTGQRWLCPAPMSDAFLVLADAPGGPTCFLVPRVLADGSRNVFLLQRLRDLPGNRSNAFAEAGFHSTWARRVGEEGHGKQVLAGTAAAARLDRALGSAGLMRQAVARAIHHCTHQEASGGRLADQPLERNVLADLALESEAATALALRLAAAHDDDGEQERAFLRLAVPAAKYWITKRCTQVAVEAAECLGDDGCAEESGLPRLVRGAPPNSLWDGAGNAQARDVLRVLRQDPAALDACLTEIGRAHGADHRLDRAVRALFTELADLDGIEPRARRLAERLALILQASLLTRHAPPEVSDAFCASRLTPDQGATFGTLPSGLFQKEIVARATPTC